MGSANKRSGWFGRVGGPKRVGKGMADESSFILRLTGLALAYAAFTLTVESSKQPIRKFVDGTSGDPLRELLTLASTVFGEISTAASLFASGRRGGGDSRAPATPASCLPPEIMRTKSAETARVSLFPREDPCPANVVVDDLCDSCRNGWIMASALSSSFASVSGVK